MIVGLRVWVETQNEYVVASGLARETPEARNAHSMGSFRIWILVMNVTCNCVNLLQLFPAAIENPNSPSHLS